MLALRTRWQSDEFAGISIFRDCGHGKSMLSLPPTGIECSLSWSTSILASCSLRSEVRRGCEWTTPSDQVLSSRPVLVC